MTMMRKPTLMEFIKYEIVRRDGQYNMIMECSYAADAAGLGMPEYANMLNNYEWCRDQWINGKFKIKQVIHTHGNTYEVFMKDNFGKDEIYNFDKALENYEKLALNSINADYEVVSI